PSRQRREVPRGHWSQRDAQNVLARLEAGGTQELTLGGLDKAMVLGKRSLKAFTEHLTVKEWQLPTAPGQTLYIKQLRKRAQQDITTPDTTGAAYTHSAPARVAGGSLLRHTVINLLNDFAQALPARTSGETALRVVAKLVATPQLTEKAIQT